MESYLRAKRITAYAKRAYPGLFLDALFANLACGRVVQHYGTHVYTLSGNPQGAEMCEGDITADGLSGHYLVRDTGMLNLVGNYVCSQLSKNLLPDVPSQNNQ